LAVIMVRTLYLYPLKNSRVLLLLMYQKMF
jgi:hypothetical protein